MRNENRIQRSWGQGKQVVEEETGGGGDREGCPPNLCPGGDLRKKWLSKLQIYNTLSVSRCPQRECSEARLQLLGAKET